MKEAIALNISNLTDFQKEKVVKKLHKLSVYNKGWKIEFLNKQHYTHLIYEGKEEVDEDGFISKGWKLTSYTSENGYRATTINFKKFLEL